MWEVHNLNTQDVVITGITPTYVGSTSSNSSMSNHLQGSPPRMWEVQTKVASEILRDGITPTYVGSTLKDPSKIAIPY